MDKRVFLRGLAAGTAVAAGMAQAAQAGPLRVGVRGGVDEEIWEVVTRVAREQGLQVKPVVISGAASPIEALNNGDIEANSFQHVPFLRDQNQQRGYRLVAAGDTYISPIAFYSRKHKRVADLPEGARLGIPNDPSNQTRALVVLQDQGILTLREGFDPFKGTAGLADIASYRKRCSWWRQPRWCWRARWTISMHRPSSTALPTRPG
jgi:D-methionine transport system substrate-binding protein